MTTISTYFNNTMSFGFACSVNHILALLRDTLQSKPLTIPLSVIFVSHGPGAPSSSTLDQDLVPKGFPLNCGLGCRSFAKEFTRTDIDYV